MLNALGVVLPIFALIGAGFAARRLDWLGPQASSELNRFVVFLALPALLFDIMATAQARDIWRPDFLAAFGLAVSLVFVAAFAARRRAGRPLADAALDGLGAAYGNTGYVGIPLCLIALGPQARAPAVLATLYTACALFGGAIALIEAGLQGERRPLRLAAKVLASLARNPLVVAPAAGLALNAASLSPPAQVEAAIHLLGQAASPCALVALGLFFAGRSKKPTPGASGAALLIALKLVAAPALALAFSRVFGLDAFMTRACVVMAALPTGTGAFMLAEYYRREAELASQVVLVSTGLSILTISAYLAFSA
ncbi:AEC family transporter [Methylocella sp.]|uniref:AEC family transporter n=1 Tax=Methylocella sp. TaxID=1978226 RepID=UPI003783FD7B